MEDHEKIRRFYYHWLDGLKKIHGDQTPLLAGMTKAAFCAGWKYAKFCYGMKDDAKEKNSQ